MKAFRKLDYLIEKQNLKEINNMNNNRGFEDKRFDDIHEAIDMLNKEIDNTFERIDKFKRNIKIAGIVAGTAVVAFIVKNVIVD